MKLRKIFGDLIGGVVLAVIVLGLALAPITQARSLGVNPTLYQEPVKNIQVLFASAARTASANSLTLDVGEADVLVLYVSNTATSGTSPTLDVKLQDSPDGGTTWFDVAGAAITQVTSGTSSQIVTATRKFSRKIRCVITIGGTSPSFTCAAWFLAYKSYSNV